MGHTDNLEASTGLCKTLCTQKPSACAPALILQGKHKMICSAMQSSMRTEDLLRQRGAQTPSLYQQTPSQPQRQSPFSGYSSELTYSAAGSGLHGGQFPASAAYSQGEGPGKHLEGVVSMVYIAYSRFGILPARQIPVPWQALEHRTTPGLKRQGWPSQYGGTLFSKQPLMHTLQSCIQTCRCMLRCYLMPCKHLWQYLIAFV